MTYQPPHLPLGLPARVLLRGVVGVLDAHVLREPPFMGAANTAQASLIFLHQSLARLLLSYDGPGMGVKVGEPIALDFEQSHFLHLAQGLPPGG